MTVTRQFRGRVAAGLPAEPRQRREQAGFTLVELLIAIVLLMVGIVAVAQLVPAAITTNFRNRNDSTALIAAQRQLEQMTEQPLVSTVVGACPNNNPPAGHYAFCDIDGDAIALGQATPGPLTALTGGPTVNVAENGCPLVAGTAQLDFSVPAANCEPGYTRTKQWVWNPVTNVRQSVELRWRVVTWHSSGFPKRKVFIVGARAGNARQSFVVANLQTVVGP